MIWPHRSLKTVMQIHFLNYSTDNNMTNKEKFLKLVSQESTKTVSRAKDRFTRRGYTRISQQIALVILERLDQLNWTQKRLAEEMGVSPQIINKWIKGQENFTIDTIEKLSERLNMELIEVKTVSL